MLLSEYHPNDSSNSLEAEDFEKIHKAYKHVLVVNFCIHPLNEKIEQL